jgi:hypothetical protein
MSRKEIASTAEAAREPVRPHQPGQAVLPTIAWFKDLAGNILSVLEATA